MGVLALAALLASGFALAALINAALDALGLPPPAVTFANALISSSLIAQRSLAAHVREVEAAFCDSTDAARAAVAKIVGRDVAGLDEAGISRAAIESLAENFSDAVVAPAFWLALGGLPLGFCYKAINTADSMIGHRTAHHAAFGYAAAKLDDAVNFLPARLSALLVMAASFFLAGASPTAAWRTVGSDVSGHPSPNAPWPEAAFAGALHLRLGGPRAYGGAKLADAWIGEGKAPTRQDIKRALLLYRRACLIHWVVLMALAFVIAQA